MLRFHIVFSTVNFISEHIYSSYSHTSYVTKAEGLGSPDLKMTYTAIRESKKAPTDLIGSGAQPSSLAIPSGALMQIDQTRKY
jgi:hypothetical protein